MAKNRKLTFLNYWSHKMKLFEIKIGFFFFFLKWGPEYSKQITDLVWKADRIGGGAGW